jgi:bla regulator protein BlaR1
MQHLFQSSFLQALGYAIANSLWQTALVWLIYMSVTGLLSMNAAAKYRLAVVAQVTGFTWFIITFQFYYREYSNAWQHASGVQVSRDIQNIVSSNTDLSSRLINWMVKGEQLLPYISMAYLLLMVFLCIRWFMGYRQTQLIRNNGLQKMPAEWRLFVNKVAVQLGITKKIQIFLSNTITTPLTIGFLKPVILIPVASINHLTTDQLEAVLLHELAHIKRYDYLANMILSVVEISLFFNPFTQLLSKSIRKERENSCDDWVLQFQYDASLYAEALLRIAYLQTAPAFAMAASGKKNDLLVRVKRMIEKKENRFSYRRQLLAFLIVTGILSSIAWLNPITSHTEKQTTVVADKKLLKKKVQQYAVEPMAVRVDNPLFNPVFFLSKPLQAEMKKSIVAAQKEMEETVSLPGDPKEKIPFIESISPMVAGALEQAAFEMTKHQPDWEKSIAQMEAAKIDMGKAFHTDSAFLPPKLRRRFKEELTGSMQKMDVEWKKAKSEMERSFKISSDVVFNNDEMQLNIQKAMEAVEDLKKLGLEKLVISALQIPGMMLDGNGEPHMQQLHSFPKEGTEKRKLRIPSAANAPDAPQPGIDSENLNEDKTGRDEEVSKPRMRVLSPMNSLPEMEKIKQDVAAISKIKDLILQEYSEKKIRLMPVVAREKKPDDQRVVIRLQ